MMNEKSKSQHQPLLPLFEKFIKESKSGKRLQINGKRLSKGSIINYEVTYNHLIKFSTTKNFLLQIVNTKKLNKRELFIEKNYWRKFYKKFTDYLYYDRHNFDNAVGLQIKTIRTFFGYLNNTLLIETSNFQKNFYVCKQDIPIITILPEQLNFLIYNQQFEDSLSLVLKECKDFFVFGCTVALRYGDLFSLQKSNLRKTIDGYYLVVRSKKTNTDTQIILPEYAVTIANKYMSKKGNFLLPRFNNVRLNLLLKVLCKQAGFLQYLKKDRTIRGISKKIINKTNNKIEMFKFCDLVTTHTMRRSAITIMLSLGMPEHIVRKISGHAPGSNEFYRYVALAQTYQDTESMQVYEKLKTKKVEAEFKYD